MKPWCFSYSSHPHNRIWKGTTYPVRVNANYMWRFQSRKQIRATATALESVFSGMGLLRDSHCWKWLNFLPFRPRVCAIVNLLCQYSRKLWLGLLTNVNYADFSPPTLPWLVRKILPSYTPIYNWTWAHIIVLVIINFLLKNSRSVDVGGRYFSN